MDGFYGFWKPTRVDKDNCLELIKSKYFIIHIMVYPEDPLAINKAYRPQNFMVNHSQNEKCEFLILSSPYS